MSRLISRIAGSLSSAFMIGRTEPELFSSIVPMIVELPSSSSRTITRGLLKMKT